MTEKVVPLAGILEKDIVAAMKEFTKYFKNMNVIQKPVWVAGQARHAVKSKSINPALMKEAKPV